MERVRSAASKSPVTAEQREAFGSLADFAGRTFQGVATEDSAGSVTDVQLWLWNEDGKALIVKHRLEDGSYGGDSMITKDAATGKLSSVYKTNAGFSTTGIITLNEDGSWDSTEDVIGTSNVTKVRSRGHVREDGALISVSEYLLDGEWVPGNSFVYTEVWKDLPELDTPIQE